MSFSRMTLGNKYGTLSKNIVVILAMIMLSCSPSNSASAEVQCRDVTYGNPKYHESMNELAKKAGLADNSWNRYHESLVRDLCKGMIIDVNKLIDDGFVKPDEAQAIARVLGKAYKPSQLSQIGNTYSSARNKFIELGACSACADNIAQHYSKTPDSPCGKLAKQALEGEPVAIKKMLEFPDYCRWKY